MKNVQNQIISANTPYIEKNNSFEKKSIPT